MVSTDYFREGLLAQMHRASRGGLIDVLINSRELYRSLGGYPGSTNGMRWHDGALSPAPRGACDNTVVAHAP
jgi:hypothetical protein